MRYQALACDYDGTLATDGRASPAALEALERLRRSGRSLLLVTGRLLDDLRRVFPLCERFDAIIAENGALLHLPSQRRTRSLAEPPERRLLENLRRRRVPMELGRSIVATVRPYEQTMLECIRDTGLELKLTFNRGAVMALPGGITKATGLQAALLELGLSPHNVVGIGDAENDHAFLDLCECSVAVADGLPAVRARADWVTPGGSGAGVAELAERLLRNDLRDVRLRPERQHVDFGTAEDGGELGIRVYGENVLIAGAEGGGKTTLAQDILDRLGERGYQLCVVDPEGDYDSLNDALVLGDQRQAPPLEEVLQVLTRPRQSCVVNLLGVPVASRPAFFDRLLVSFLQHRAETGRPHWVLFDEAHPLMPASRLPPLPPPGAATSMLFVTVHPDHVSRAALAGIDTVIAVGSSPQETFRRFAAALGEPEPPPPPRPPLPGEAVAWRRSRGEAPILFKTAAVAGRPRRHKRKYAEGDLGPDRSFYFRGPDQRLNLKAQNLLLFLQIGDGVDDATWDYTSAAATSPAGSRSRSRTRSWPPPCAPWRRPSPPPGKAAPGSARSWRSATRVPPASPFSRPNGPEFGGPIPESLAGP